jgi:hypothetical protein
MFHLMIGFLNGEKIDCRQCSRRSNFYFSSKDCRKAKRPRKIVTQQ